MNVTYARLWETVSWSKRAQEQGCSPSGADVASILARLCETLTGFPVSLQGALELYRALTLDPGYKDIRVEATVFELRRRNSHRLTRGTVRMAG